MKRSVFDWWDDSSNGDLIYTNADPQHPIALPTIPEAIQAAALILELWKLDEEGSILGMDVNSTLNKMNNQQLQELLWKVKQAKAEGVDAPFTKASIYWDPGLPGYRMSVPYDAAFVAGLKTFVPDTERLFDQMTKTWTIVGEAYFIRLQTLIFQHYPVDKIGQIKSKREYDAEFAAAQAMNQPLSKEQKAAFTFVAFLDLESLNAAFKKRCVTLHPDKGGKSEDFSEFNAAYQMLKEELSK